MGAPTQFPRGLCAARLPTFWQSAGSLPFSPRKGNRKGKLPNTGRRGRETRLPPEVWLEVLLARSAAAGARLAFSAVLLAPAWQNREPLGWLRRASPAFGRPSAHLPGRRGRRPRLAAIFLHLCSEACCQTLSVFRHLPPIRRDGPAIHILLPTAGSRYYSRLPNLLQFLFDVSRKRRSGSITHFANPLGNKPPKHVHPPLQPLPRSPPIILNGRRRADVEGRT